MKVVIQNYTYRWHLLNLIDTMGRNLVLLARAYFANNVFNNVPKYPILQQLGNISCKKYNYASKPLI